MLIFDKKALFNMLFQIVSENPIISEIKFLWRHAPTTLFPSLSDAVRPFPTFHKLNP